MAWVIIGSLTSSMFLALVIVPLVYYLMDRMLVKFAWDKNGCLGKTVKTGSAPTANCHFRAATAIRR
ncbi:MAG: hypothetical protein LBT25_11690 [Candidatus Symbiothrix sp.]|nr:hypothetical protein [Candidatus Symbiothrix sp.]